MIPILKINMDDQLDKEYEEWLDEIEKSLPLPVPEEINMNTTKAFIVMQLQKRLATLEAYREEIRSHPNTVKMVDEEMTAVRFKLKDVMNSQCPLLKEK